MNSSPDVDAVFLVLQPFVVAVLGVGTMAIRLPANRVPMPRGPFVGLTPILALALSTNVKGPIANEAQGTTRPSELTVQVDVYGPASAEQAATLSILLRDNYACEYFAERNPAVAPLFASDARQLPLVNGEDQYEDRWTFEAVLQFNPSIVVPQQSANTLSVNGLYPVI